MKIQKIIQIAANTNNYGLKNVYSHKSFLKNKVCGDTIKVEFKVSKDKIMNFRYETTSCIYCQASASLLARKIKIFSIKTLKKDVLEIKNTLKKNEYKLSKKMNPFKDLFNIDNANRIECILLPFDATIKALKI